MRITCPHCGDRDRREFTWSGAHLPRPTRGAAPADWDAYVHLRDNAAGATRELWYHDPCGAFLVADRDTVTHVIHATALARTVPR
jgi:heterotetrameric sarcosine oxidase delta subunit